MLLHTMSLSETSIASIERTSPSRVEIRFKPEVYIDTKGFAEVFQERIRLCGTDHVHILMVIPTDAEIDPTLMATDHFKANGGVEGVQAIASVSGSSVNEMLTSLYFAYFPQAFPARVFNTEQEAGDWLARIPVTVKA